MLRFSVVLVLLLVCSFTLGQSDMLKTTDTMPKPTTTTSTTTTTMPKPATTTTTTTTTPETTSTTSPTTTTLKPTTTTSTTTTTPKPTTTTSITTTTPNPTTTTSPTTTTPKPTTTTPKPTTTTSTPPTTPTPQQGNWSYTDHNVTCVILQFTARLNVTYTIKDKSNNTKLSNALLNIPSDAKVIEGSCNNALQWIKLSWPDKTWKNNVTLAFRSKPADQSYSLTRVNIVLTADNEYFPNSTVHQLNFTQILDQWTTPLKNSYRCLKQTDIDLTGSWDSWAAGTLTLSQLQAQAFKTESGREFGAAQDCDSGSGGMSGGAVAAIVIFTLLSLAALGAFLYLKGYITIF